jgi:hypothetical protein
MNDTKNALIYALAINGVCALLYGGWTIYQHYAAQEEAGEFFRHRRPWDCPIHYMRSLTPHPNPRTLAPEI